LASDPPLELGKRQCAAALPWHDLAVDHGAVRKMIACLDELGIPVGHQLAAARPHEGAAVAPDELRADAVPLPLGLPLARVAERLELSVERVGEVERERTRHVRIAAVR